MKPKLLIILASTRPGRVGLPVARWFEQLAIDDGRFEIAFVDLAELALPLLDEPKHPRLRDYAHSHTRAWSEMVDAADTVALVTAEYNYGYPAALKNALDYLHHEWRHKPLAFVSYGGVAAGTRSVQQLKQVIGALQLVPTATAVNIPFVANLIDDGRLVANTVMEQAATAMLGELEMLHGALAPLRANA